VDNFGCCSHYKECSNIGSCLFLNDEDYSGCIYSKNLSKGLNFYSANKNLASERIVQKCAQVVEKCEQIVENLDKRIEKINAHIYIDCLERNFKIGRLGKTGFSYPLEQTEIGMIIDCFNINKIPYATETDSKKCVMEGTVEEPANSRVVFKLPEIEQEFVISNFNAAYIKKRYADGIAKALKNKGLTASVSLVGAYARVTTYPKQAPVIPKQTMKAANIDTQNITGKIMTAAKALTKQFELNGNNSYKQISLWDLGLA
jgi:hypothetical protein